MSIEYIIASFACGIFASSLGSCGAFAFAGIIGIGGIGVAAAMNAAALSNSSLAADLFPAVASGNMDVLTAVYNNLGPVLENITFGPMLGPAIAFTAPLWAGAYAHKRGYVKAEAISDTMCWFPQLDQFRRLDILFAGGIGGVIGASINWFVSQFLGLGIDGAVCSIVITCLLCKLWIEGRLISPKTEEGKKLGSRLGPNQIPGWFPFLRIAGIRYTLAIAAGACFAYTERMLMLNPITFSFAHTIGFLIGACLFLLLMMGFKVMVFPPITASATFLVKGMIIVLGNTPEAAASVSTLTFMLWGAAGGIIGITACDIMLQLFRSFSNVYLDPPASGIIWGSFVAFTVVPRWFPVLAYNNIFPVCCIAFALIYSILEYVKCRGTNIYTKIPSKEQKAI